MINKIKILLTLTIIAMVLTTCGENPVAPPPKEEDSRTPEEKFKNNVSGFTFSVDNINYRIVTDKIVSDDYSTTEYVFEKLIDNKGIYKKNSVVRTLTDEYIAIKIKEDSSAGKIYGGSTSEEAASSTRELATANIDSKAQKFLDFLKGKSGKTMFMEGQQTDFSPDGRSIKFTVGAAGTYVVVYYEFAGLASDNTSRGYYRLGKADKASPMTLGDFCGWDITEKIKVYIGSGEGVDINDPSTAPSVWNDPNPYTFTPGA